MGSDIFTSYILPLLHSKILFLSSLHIYIFLFYAKLIKHSTSLQFASTCSSRHCTGDKQTVHVQTQMWTQQAVKVLCKVGVAHILLYSSAEHACYLLHV